MLTGMGKFDRGGWVDLGRWLKIGRRWMSVSGQAAAACLPGGGARWQVAAPHRKFAGVYQNNATEH
jgi:hypothetical protein